MKCCSKAILVVALSVASFSAMADLKSDLDVIAASGLAEAKAIVDAYNAAPPAERLPRSVVEGKLHAIEVTTKAQIDARVAAEQAINRANAAASTDEAARAANAISILTAPEQAQAPCAGIADSRNYQACMDWQAREGTAKAWQRWAR